MKGILACVIFVAMAIPSCATGTTNKTKIDCKINPVPGYATFCSKTVAVNFGPADQFIGYSFVQGQVVSMLKADMAESMFSIRIEHKKTFIKDIRELVLKDNVMSYKSGNKGENSMSVDPGNYVICTQPKQYSSIDQPILSCQPADIEIDHQYKLLIIDNPRTGIQFEWKK